MQRLLVNSRKGCLALAAAALMLTSAAAARAQGYVQHNLVSDQPSVAPRTDPNLVNAWGIASSATGPLWVADNGTGVSTVYQGNGLPYPKPHAALVVTIPPPAGGTGSTPSGIAHNDTGDFLIQEGGGTPMPSRFIFATEDGTIAGWNPGVDPANAILAADLSSTGAVFKGVALGSSSSGNFLFATDFHNGFVDIFDASFTFVTSFTDPTIPSGYAPFGIRNIGGLLYVTYAKQLPPDNHDDDPGPGHGYVDVFDTTGALIMRLASQGTLNSPWGLAMAPANFGQFSNDLLVGNFGDGRINAFDPATGDFKGQLADPSGAPVTIDGLWGLTFGNGALGGKTNRLYFTAGPDHEAHGLFGMIHTAADAGSSN